MSDSVSSRVWVDPPAGWCWGFPKVYDGEKDGPMETWLKANGYPFPNGVEPYCQCWPAADWELGKPHAITATDPLGQGTALTFKGKPVALLADDGSLLVREGVEVIR